VVQTTCFQQHHFQSALADSQPTVFRRWCVEFATDAAANAGLGTRHRLHLHRESWEYYVVLNGAKTLQIEDEVVTIRSGEMLEVAPGVKHTLRSRQAPYRGFTFRIPLREDKEEF
jgi:mannose-6-phosphate isomerase-like protein (cupin superfamily)